MLIRFRKVRIHNFLSFADEEVYFEDMGYTIVTGKNSRKIDNALSNGSGKSTIFNAVCYALTGETAQGLSNNVENVYSNPDDCWVELDFSIDDDRFVIKRIKTPRTDLKIYINGVDASGKGVKESTKLLTDYIPELNSRLIGSIIILGQGLPYRFTNNNPSGRKEILEKLTKSDFMIQSIREKLDVRMEELKSQRRSYEDSVVSNKTKASMTDKQLTLLHKELEALSASLSVSIDEVDRNIEQCKNYLKDSVAKKEELSCRLSEITEIATASMETYYSDISEVTNKYNSITSVLVSSIAESKASIKSVNAEIKKAKTMTDVCPTCGQKIPDDHKIDITALAERLKLEEDKLKDLQNKSSSNEASKNDELSRLKIDFTSKNSEMVSKKDCFTSEYRNLEKECNSIQTKLNDLIRLRDNVYNVSSKKTSLENSISENNKYKAELDTELGLLEDNICETDKHISIIQTMITLTKREFRGVLLEHVIKYINTKCKEYSKYVFDTELLAFELNENYIDIKYDGKYYEALSGGEKQKVDIIIQLAIRDLLSNQLNIHSSLLVCDEIFDNLDTQGCQRVLDLISKMKDIESIFIISHFANELQISYDNRLDVEKGDDGISTVKLH